MVEALDRHYQKLGLKVVAVAISATKGYHIVLRAPVGPSGDLQGRKIRGTPSYHTVIGMLGASPVVLPGGEVYSALEKGVEEAWFKEYDRMVQDEEAELIKRGMQVTEMGEAQKTKVQAAWAQAQWDLAEKKSGQEAKDLREMLKRQGLTD